MTIRIRASRCFCGDGLSRIHNRRDVKRHFTRPAATATAATTIVVIVIAVIIRIRASGRGNIIRVVGTAPVSRAIHRFDPVIIRGTGGESGIIIA